MEQKQHLYLKPVAPEDIHIGDIVTPLRQKPEPDSYDSPIFSIQRRSSPSDHFGHPFRVVQFAYPFVYLVPIDLFNPAPLTTEMLKSIIRQSGVVTISLLDFDLAKLPHSFPQDIHNNIFQPPTSPTSLFTHHQASHNLAKGPHFVPPTPPSPLT